MLEATNARRAAHGRPPLDLTALEGPPPDDELRAEVRAFVDRATRAGSPAVEPLDVEAEVDRRLSGQDG